MSHSGKAYIAGIYEHPTRRADHLTTAQLHAEVALGALADPQYDLAALEQEVGAARERYRRG